METIVVKFILLSVFMAHGAVVYTVCAPAGGLFQAQNKTVTCEFVIFDRGDKEASDRGPIASTTTKSSRSNIKTYTSHTINGSSIRSCAPVEDDKSTQNGWQMSSDLSVNTSHDITIHFTVDARGYVSHITVSPFTTAIYQKICSQLKQIHFTWHGASPPPTHTLFEKKICLR